MVRITLAILLCLLLPSVAFAQKRVALVIGIDTYDNLAVGAQLTKARNDAAAVARVLRGLGFDVIAKSDVGRSAFNNHWQDLLNKLAPGDTAVFYFAGHGVEFGGRSYLLPRDVPNLKPGRDELLRREALSLQEFLADLREKGTRLNLVVLDACRDNPFEQMSGRSIGSRRGLAITDPPPEGTFIMYSAGAGESALDRLNDADRNPNSVYTRHLLPLLKTPGVTLTEVAEQVRVSVHQTAATVQHRQTPAYYNQVLGRVCLAGGECTPRVAPVPAASEAERIWSMVKDTTSIAAMEEFRRQFGGTNPIYDRLADAHIEELKRLAMLKADQKRKLNEDGKRAEVGTLRPGKVFRDCDVCPEMVVIPAGSFMMGSPTGEEGRESTEGPQHKVTIARPFAIGRFEVTFADWRACTLDGDCKHIPNDEGWGRDKRPVINVSRDDIGQFTRWLNRKTGKVDAYRLPTEAEWEYAARAGSTTRYHFGDSDRDLCTYANGADQTTTEEYKPPTEAADFFGSLSYANCRDGYATTAPVGSFRPNNFGLYDMHGNVEEWLEDCLAHDYSRTPSDGSAYHIGERCNLASRSGSWMSGPRQLRSANREWRWGGRHDHVAGVYQSFRYWNVGFRVARTL